MKVLSRHRNGGLTRTGRARAPGYTPESHSFEMLCEPHHTACDAASSVAPALGRAKNAAPRRVGFWTRARLCLSSPALAQTRHGAWLRACQRCLGGRSSIDASSATSSGSFYALSPAAAASATTGQPAPATSRADGTPTCPSRRISRRASHTCARCSAERGERWCAIISSRRHVRMRQVYEQVSRARE